MAVSEETLWDAAVIGAGISGLTAARALEAAGLRVLVIEARDRVGGRALSREVDGQVVDLGGQWLGAAHPRLAALAARMGVETFPQHVDGQNLLDLNGEVTRYRGLIPRLSLLHLLETKWRLRTLDRLARQVPLDAPHQAPEAATWDAQSVADWRATMRTPGARGLLDVAVRTIFAEEPERISLLWFLFYVRSGQGLRRLSGARGGPPHARLVGGVQGLCARMAEGLTIRLEAPVTAIRGADDAVLITAGGERVIAGRAILAIPPLLCGDVVFEPPLPAARQAAHEMPMGRVIKCVVAYPQPFWRDAGLSGAAVSDGPAARLVFDACSADASRAALAVSLLGDSAGRWSGADPADRRAAVLADLVRFFGPAAAAPTAYAEQDWIAEDFSRGGYVGLAPPGLLTRVGAALRAPVGRLHFAGTETAREWAGYFEGAVAAGERAAAELIAAG